AATAHHLAGALDLLATTHQRVDLAGPRAVVEVGGVFGQGVGLALALRSFGALAFRRRGAGLRLVAKLGDAVREVIDDVQAGHVLLGQEIDRVRILLAEDRHQHVGAGDLLLAGGLHVVHGPLQDALEAQRRLGVAAVVLGQAGDRSLDGLFQVHAQALGIGATGAQDGLGGRVVEHGQQQVLDRHELMTCLAGPLVALADGLFEVFAEHGLLRRFGNNMRPAAGNSTVPTQRRVQPADGRRPGGCPRRSGLLHGAQQRVLVHAGELVDLGYLGFGHFAREDTADAAAAGMDVQHDLGRALQVQGEELLQDHHHEVHRGVVVIEQDHLVHRRRGDLRPAGVDQGAVLVFVLVSGGVGHGRDYTFRCPPGPGHGRRRQRTGQSPARPGVAMNLSLRPAALLAALALSPPLSAQPPDLSLAPLLDTLGYAYEVDEDGDYRLLMEVPDSSRTQFVFVRSPVEEFGTTLVREVWSPAWEAEGEFPA